MDPVTAVIPLTFQSPQFWIELLLIALAGFIALQVGKIAIAIASSPAGDKFVNPQFAITVSLLLLILFVIWIAFYGPTPASNDIQVAIITAVIINGLPELRKYWLNSTSESEKKNDTINAQAQTIAGTGNGLSAGASMFPLNPVPDQVYTVAGVSWKWNGLGWMLQTEVAATQ